MSNQLSIELDGGLPVNINSFQRHLKAWNRIRGTIRTHVEVAELFDEFPSTGEHPQRLAELRAEHVELFISSQLDRHTAAAAANRYRSLQSFFKWAAA